MMWTSPDMESLLCRIVAGPDGGMKLCGLLTESMKGTYILFVESSSNIVYRPSITEKKKMFVLLRVYDTGGILHADESMICLSIGSINITGIRMVVINYVSVQIHGYERIE